MLGAMDRSEFFRVERTDAGIAHLQLKRPERMNTMALGFFPALRDAVHGLDADGATRVLVIGSTGRHFSAGMSLDVFDGALDASLPTATPRARLAVDHATAEALAQMALLQSAIFDLPEMARAIAAWKAKGSADFEPLLVPQPLQPT
jgi:enoyl-CoA hydratase